MSRRLTRSTLFPYTTLFRSLEVKAIRRRQMHARHRRIRESVLERRIAVRHAERLRRGVGLVRRGGDDRSEEHTSELQSRSDLVCRLLLERKKMLERKL